MSETATAEDQTSRTVIESNAAPFYAYSILVNALVDEARVHVSEDGLYTRVVDAANVAMLEVEFPPEAFETFDFGGIQREIGLNTDRFGRVINFANKGQGPDGGDPVTWIPELTDPELYTRLTVSKEDGVMTMAEDWATIKPGSLRQEPDLPELDLKAQADPSTKTLRDGLQYLKEKYPSDHVILKSDSGDPETLVLQSEGDTSEATLRFPESVYPDSNSDGKRALYSLDYLADMADAVHSARMDKVTLNWGEEFPVKLKFQSEDWGVEGTYMLAPRIKAN